MKHSIDKETGLDHRNISTPSKRVGDYKRIQESRRIRPLAKHSIPDRRSLAILLPPELISMILWMVLENSQSNFYHDYENGYVEQIRSVLNATRTCRHWRAAVLGDRALWGALINIENNQKVWLEELIQRSGSSGPLVVQSQDFFEDTRDNWDVIFRPDNISKIKVLQVEGPESHLFTVLDRFCQPAPALKCFKIKEAPIDYGPTVFHTDITLFANCSPALKCLSIDVGFFLPRIDFFSGFKLTHLSIHNADTCLGMDIIDWLDVLAEQTYLECLHLAVIEKFDYPYRESQSSPEFCKVHLDKLKVLRLEGFDISEAGDLLANLIFPASCNVIITLDQSKEIHYFLDGLERGLTRYLRSWGSRVNYCAVRAGLDDKLEIVFEGKQNLSSDWSDLGSLTIHYSVKSDFWNDDAYISPLSSFLDIIRIGAQQLTSITGAEMIFNFSLEPSQKDLCQPENANLKQSLLALFSAFSSQTSFLLLDDPCSVDIIRELVKSQVPEPGPLTSMPIPKPEGLFPNLSDLAIYDLETLDDASPERYLLIQTMFDVFQDCKRRALNGSECPTDTDSVDEDDFTDSEDEIVQSEGPINGQQYDYTQLGSMSVGVLGNIHCPSWREVPDEYVSYKRGLVFQSDRSKQQKEICRHCSDTLAVSDNNSCH